jgi:hypothetical protein
MFFASKIDSLCTLCLLIFCMFPYLNYLKGKGLNKF